MQLTHRKIIVVGGSPGMGFAVVRAALMREAQVIVVGRDAGRLAQVASESGVQTITADVTQEDEVARLFSLTYALAVALAPIRVNVLSPGWVDTPILESVAGANKPAMV
ncbi:MAG TPA: SDR family NAD(P)-dependent oxidoreductase, partial [Ktedonobacteraceae bacterium]